jgi:DNA-binding NarL/FixJ family response regulator
MDEVRARSNNLLSSYEIYRPLPGIVSTLPVRSVLMGKTHPMSAPRILVVDDHDIVRQGVCALIAAQPEWIVCGEARNGRDAIRLAAELKPDVIVMDLLMPDLNGLDAARQIKKATPEIEILVLSGHEETELVQTVFDAGIRAYIFKSQARTHLVPGITALLSHKPYLTSKVSEVLFRRFEQQASGQEKESRTEAALTAREREIVQLLAEGRSNKEVASSLAISIKTVETHRASIMRKLNLGSLSDLVRFAIRTKIIEP